MEVVVAIVILAVAILPMASMFDSALNASRASGDYDKARALAHRTLEGIRALEHERAVGEYGGEAPTSCAAGKLDCSVRTEFVDDELAETPDHESRMLVRVSVRWDGKSYETSGIVAAERL